MPRPLQRAHEAACASQYPMARSIPGYRIFSPVAELKSQTLKSDCPRYLCQSNCVASEPATLPSGSRTRPKSARALLLSRSGRTQIGRASCRERVCQYVWISVVAVSFKKKIKNYTKHT